MFCLPNHPHPYSANIYQFRTKTVLPEIQQILITHSTIEQSSLILHVYLLFQILWTVFYAAIVMTPETSVGRLLSESGIIVSSGAAMVPGSMGVAMLPTFSSRIIVSKLLSREVNEQPFRL